MPKNLSNVFKVCRFTFTKSELDDSPDAFDIVACLGVYGADRRYFHLHQAHASPLLPPHFLGQSEVAAHRVVGHPSVCHSVVLRRDRFLSLSVLAGPMVLDTVLPKVPR